MAGGFAWTIPLIQCCFAMLFLAARRAGAAPETRCWGLGYFLNAAGFAVVALDPVLPSQVIAVAADTLFALACFHFGDALVRRYGVRALAGLRRALLAVAIAAPVFAVLVADDLSLELFGSDLGCAAQIALPLILMGRWPANWTERGMLGLSWLVVAINIARALSLPVTASGATIQSFLGTTYSYLMYADVTLTSAAFGVLALVAVIADLVAGYRREASVDPLTGLLNRRGLDAGVGSPGAMRVDGVIACDLDHFKRVNDTFGHGVGDRVLIAFADLVRAVLPPGGVAARVGGEEFVLYLPGHGPAQSRAVAMRLGAAMAQRDWSADGLGWRQSASFGLATRTAARCTLAEAVRAADAELYEAKRRGRDRVHGLLAA